LLAHINLLTYSVSVVCCVIKLLLLLLLPVASARFVARRGKAEKVKIRSWGTHSGLQGRVQQLLDSFVTDAVLIERAASCWHLHQLILQTTQCLDSWLSDLLQSELKMKLLKVEGACPSAPYSWRRHWLLLLLHTLSC